MTGTNDKHTAVTNKVFKGDLGAEAKYSRQLLESIFMMNISMAEAMAELQPELYTKYLDKINGYDPYLKANMMKSLDVLACIKSCLGYPESSIGDIESFRERLIASHPEWVAPVEEVIEGE